MPRHDSVLLLKLVVKLANAPSHIQATSARASASASSRRSEASWTERPQVGPRRVGRGRAVTSLSRPDGNQS